MLNVEKAIFGLDRVPPYGLWTQAHAPLSGQGVALKAIEVSDSFIILVAGRKGEVVIR